MSTPASPTNGAMPLSPRGVPGFVPLVCVVDFHHARGPEVEKWFGADDGRDPAAEYDWTLLPFMALSDGAHAATEDFSYFTLLRPASETESATSLFGISCTRQMDSSQLLVRPAEVTRSTVQKAVVVIADTPQYFGMLRERLSVVTNAWFAQREFTDTEILRRFQESLAEEKLRGTLNEEEDRDQYLGMSLRELVREFRWQTLVLLKCCLLQPKMLFFGSRCERLCMMQFSLISLIPGLLRNLQDSAGPDLNNYEKRLAKPTSLRTSDRNSLLSYMGLPLQIFGKGSLFGPYTPLQQLDVLADFGTKSYIVGSTNSLLLQQRDRYSDILINLDEDSINITSTSLKAALQLSVADRRWIDFITQNVNDTWDEANPGRPKTLGYVGSEEFIRLQFEEYLLALISSVKYHNHLTKHKDNPRMLLPDVEGDPSVDYGLDFVDAWQRTENYRIWNSHTDSHLFDIVPPKHPCAGGLTIDDVQRRITQQVQELHLDERFAVGKEVLGRNLAAGREKASTVFNKLYADMEALREAQKKRAEEAKAKENSEGAAEKNGASTTQQTIGVKAGAFVNSWAAWAGEKRKAAGWGRASTTNNESQSNRGGGWGSGWGRSSNNNNRQSSYAKMENNDSGAWTPRAGSTASSSTAASPGKPQEQRALNRGSLSGESMFDAAGSESGMSSPVSPRRRPLSGDAATPVPIASTPVIDAVVSAAVSVDVKGPQNGSTTVATAEATTPTPSPAPEKKDIPAVVVQPTSALAPEEDTPTPPLTPVPVAVAAAEAAEAQNVWGR
ncbi:transport protein Avl9-domain-containing protein [Cercophora newfieldiana]|uniref:Transport protein Avl9-domain-containing protein n=1 Tax=Cercophora newfieldiana TaxID=92897 RepID=A0AA40CP22_9PEZI|nr:transport protein Avl9-domain-containing protein [Cercophora newfieldiana]